MPPALGSEAPQKGAEYLCLDSGPLISFNDADALDLLAELVGEPAYSPLTVNKLELSKRPTQNKGVLDAPWLTWVEMYADDGPLVSNLLKRFGKGPPENLGEAEVIALCKRHGWIAVLDDDVGREAAKDEGVRSVYTVSLLTAATTCQKLTPTQAWKLHVRMEKNRGRFSHMKPDDAYKEIFMEYCQMLHRLAKLKGEPEWPAILQQPLDALMLQKLDAFRRSP